MHKTRPDDNGRPPWLPPETHVWRPTTFTYIVWPSIAAVLAASIYFSLGELGAFFVGVGAGLALVLEFGDS